MATIRARPVRQFSEREHKRVMAFLETMINRANGGMLKARAMHAADPTIGAGENAKYWEHVMAGLKWAAGMAHKRF